IKQTAEKLLSARVALAITATASLIGDNKPEKPVNYSAIVSEAMLVGSATDGLPPDLADDLANRQENFVGKCGICSGVREGWCKYGRNAKEAVPCHLKKEYLLQLKSSDRDVRYQALTELVAKYVTQYLDKL